MLSKQLTRQLLTNCRNVSRCFATDTPATPGPKIPKDILRKPNQALSQLGLGKLDRISRSMKIYLEQAQANSAMIKNQQVEYELGKRHLANIMGYDYNNMTAKNIKQAIEYLLPSGLTSRYNRPELLSPEEVYPKIKSADFDPSGRPFHCFAYTGCPLFYQDMHDIYELYKKCDDIKEKMMKQGVLDPPPEAKADLTGSRWLNFNEYKNKLDEKVSEAMWNSFEYSIGQLANHPYSSVAKDFLIKFRRQLPRGSKTKEIPPITYTENGRPYAEAEGRRKHCVAKVIVWGNGSGLIDINGYDILYFPQIKEREQILFPLLFTEMLNKVDIKAEVKGDGEAAQAGAVRHGIAQALMSFVDAQMLEKLRLSGLLTKDRRIRERKKPGQPSARKSAKWRPR